MFDATSRPQELLAEPPLPSSFDNALSITQKRILFVIAERQAKDQSGFPLTNIRLRNIQRGLIDVFQVAEDHIKASLEDLTEKGFLKTYNASTPQDFIYDLTPKSLQIIGVSVYQSPKTNNLETALEKLNIQLDCKFSA